MPIAKGFCENHPDRAAIGVCVITRTPICEECSTRYEGVNYSREGLRILQERRAKARPAAKRGFKRMMAFAAVAATAPILFLICVGGIYIIAAVVTKLVV